MNKPVSKRVHSPQEPRESRVLRGQASAPLENRGKRIRKPNAARGRSRLPEKAGKRRRCESCKTPDPVVVRLVRRDADLLVQILRCRKCKKTWEQIED